MSKETEKAMTTKKQAKYSSFKVSKPEQLDLFFISPDDHHSHTIELYDSIPFHTWRRPDRVEGKFLDILSRSFGYRGRDFNVTITPARIKDKDGVGRDYYPGVCEEVVEHVLRKFSADGRAVYLDDLHAFSFSMYALQNECARLGHTFSRDEIKRALMVLTNTGIQLSDESGASVLAFSPFESYGMKTLDETDASGSKKEQCFVRYNILVTNSIKNLQFRQFDYKKNLQLHSALARWFHRRLSHYFVQASYNTTYEIKLSTILRDSPLDSTNRRLMDSFRDVCKALDELQKESVLQRYETTKIYDTNDKRKVVDCFFKLEPHFLFCSAVIKANQRSKELKSLLSPQKTLTD